MRTIITKGIAAIALCVVASGAGAEIHVGGSGYTVTSGMKQSYNAQGEVTSMVVVGQFQVGFTTSPVKKQENVLPTKALSSIKDVNASSGFVLEQNYPNPFVDMTMIHFNVPQNTTLPVRVSVYNELGNLVETLVNERLTSGSHEATFTAAGLPSGFYTVELHCGSSLITRQMLLRK